MAGGPYARRVPCDVCLARGARTVATRVYEGSETDRYACPRDHEFAIEWRQIPDAPVLPEPSRDEIARRAYLRWLARGAPHGSEGAADDWLEAEREIDRGD